MNSLKQGTVTEAPSNVITTKFGDRQVLRVTTVDGEETKIWFNAGLTPHCELKKGDSVNLFFENNKIKLIADVLPQAVATLDKPNDAPIEIKEKTCKFISKETRKDISTFVSENVDLYFFIRSEVDKKAKSENLNLDNEDIRSTTTSLFISTQRKFNLA